MLKIYFTESQLDSEQIIEIEAIATINYLEGHKYECFVEVNESDAEKVKDILSEWLP